MSQSQPNIPGHDPSIIPDVPQRDESTNKYGSPVMQAILSGLRSAPDPVEFVKTNLKAPAPKEDAQITHALQERDRQAALAKQNGNIPNPAPRLPAEAYKNLSNFTESIITQPIIQAPDPNEPASDPFVNSPVHENGLPPAKTTLELAQDGTIKVASEITAQAKASPPTPVSPTLDPGIDARFIPTESAKPSAPVAPATSAATEPPPQEQKQAVSVPPEDTPLPPELDTANMSEEEAKKVSPVAKSFKDLRTHLKTTKEQLRAIEAEKEALRLENEKFKKGELSSEKEREYQERIQKLETFETVHNLKQSRFYKEKFVDPLNKLGSELSSMAQDYEIPEQVIHKAMSVQSKAERNRILSMHMDPVGATQAAALMDKMGDIQAQAFAAEGTAKETLASFHAESQRIAETEKAQRYAKIAQSSRSAWTRALHNIREKGEVTELIPRENDPKFNEEWVKPIEDQAAREYGRLVTALAERGIEELDDEIAEALANATLLSIASASAVVSRNAILEDAKKTEAQLSRLTGLSRPSIGGNNTLGVGQAVQAPPKPKGDDRFSALENAVKGHLNTILSSGR